MSKIWSSRDEIEHVKLSLKSVGQGELLSDGFSRDVVEDYSPVSVTQNLLLNKNQETQSDRKASYLPAQLQTRRHPFQRTKHT